MSCKYIILCKQLKIKGRDIASADTLYKKYKHFWRTDPNSLYMTREDVMRPQDPVWPATPLFLPAALPVAANLPNFMSRYLGLIPNQENYHELSENLFECLEEVKYDEDQQLKYYKPNTDKISKHDTRRLFCLVNTQNDKFGSMIPIQIIFNHWKKKREERVR